MTGSTGREKGLNPPGIRSATSDLKLITTTTTTTTATTATTTTTTTTTTHNPAPRTPAS